MILTWTHVTWLGQDYQHFVVSCWVVFLIAQEMDRLPKTAVTSSQHSQPCDCCCTPRAWRLRRRLPRRPVPAVRVIPIHCLPHCGGGTGGNGFVHYCFPISQWIAFHKSSNSQSTECLRYRENLTVIWAGAAWAHDTGLPPYFCPRRIAWGDEKKG